MTPSGVQPTRPGDAAHEAAHRALGEPVDVLLRRDQVDHRLGVEPVRQRQLDEDPVHVRIGGQLGDRRLDLALRRRRREVDVARPHPDLGRLALLAAHVALARRVVADEHGDEADRRRRRRPRSAWRSALEQLVTQGQCRPSRSPSPTRL